MRLRSTLLLVVLVLQAPCAAGARSDARAEQFELTLSSLSSPAASIVADAAVVDWRTRELAPASILMDLQARTAHVETDSAGFVQMGPVAFGTVPADTTRQDLGPSNWTGANAGNETSVFLVPGPDAMLSVPEAGLAVGLPEEGCRAQPMFFPRSREPLCPALVGHVAVNAQATRFQLTGDFTLFLWGFEGTVSSPMGTTPYWTGNRHSAPQASFVPYGPSEQRHMRIDVVAGALTFTVSSPSTLEAFAPTVDVTAPRSLLQGSLAGAVDDGHYVLQNGANGLQAGIRSGHVTDPAGNTVVLGPTAATPGGLPWWRITATLLSLTLAALWVGRGRLLLARAQDSMSIGNHNAAARHALRARHYPWLRRRASVLAVISLIKARRTDEAARFLDELGHTVDPAAIEFLKAVTSAVAGRPGEARVALQRCLAMDARYRAEAERNPDLRGLLPTKPAKGYT